MTVDEAALSITNDDAVAVDDVWFVSPAYDASAYAVPASVLFA
jgi:hypothetical protein